jgi:DNA-binding CsgD family transcriptional regulator
MNNIKSLAKTDLVSIMEIAYNLLSVRTTDELEQYFIELQNLFSFDGSMCALSDTETLDEKKPLFHLCTLNFSKEFIERYARELHYVNSAVFNTVLADNKPCHWKSYWSKRRDKKFDSSKKLALSYGYKDGWLSTSTCPHDKSIAALVFAGQRVDADARAETIIEYITPHFAESIRGVYGSSIRERKQNARYKLTPREYEVLNWIKEGKSSWEISNILNCSERVVIWHANNITQKLEANNRLHAVAIAMRYNIIN